MNNISKVRLSEKITNVVASVLALTWAPAGVLAVIAGTGFFSGLYQRMQQRKPGTQALNAALQTYSKELLQTLPEDTDTLAQINTLLDDVLDNNLDAMVSKVIQTVAGQNKTPAQALTQELMQCIPLNKYDNRVEEIMRRLLGASAQSLCQTEHFRQRFGEAGLVAVLQNLNRQDTKYERLTEALHTIRRQGEEALPLSKLPASEIAKKDMTLALAFDARMTDYSGREQELSDLQDFMNQDTALCWWQVSGAAGQGKSRIALELLDNLDPVWDAGLLSTGDLHDTNWNKVHFAHPTLIVLDYLAAPQKAADFVRMLSAVRNRTDINVKLRILVLEREGYCFDDKAQAGFNWLSQTLKNAQSKKVLRETAYKDEPLALRPLEPAAMQAIVQSWRKQRGKPALAQKALEHIMRLLGGKYGMQNHRSAWRPLFAMIAAELADQHGHFGGDRADSEQSIETLLGTVLDQERTTLWPKDASGTPRLDTSAENLALLTTMTGALDLSNDLERLKTPHTDDPYGFYGLSVHGAPVIGRALDRLLSHTWLMLGRTLQNDPHANTLPVLQARTPDLMGEYLVLCTLNIAAGIADARTQRIERLVQDAYALAPVGFLFDFLLRVQQDFSQHPVSKDIRNAVPATLPIPLAIAAALGLQAILQKQIADTVVAVQELNFALIAASEGGHAECVAHLLEKGAEINQVNEKNGGFPLLIAAQNGHAECVAHLLEKGAEVNQVNEKNGGFPLLMAAQNGHAECVAHLLEKGAEVNRVNEKSGTFPLLQAAQNGHAECVAHLLEKGAEVNRVNEESGTFPLLQAAQEGHAECVAHLLEKGAEVNRVNEKNGTFPLLQAAQEGHAECVVRLLEKGAEVNRVNEKNGTFPLLQAAQEGHAECVAHLLEKGAEVNRVNEESGTFPLLQAAQEGHAECVAHLLEKGAEVNRVNEKNGTFPLLQAAQEGHAECVVRLLEKGAEANQMDGKKGTVPLLMAAQNGHAECVAHLLEKGAEVNQVHEKTGIFSLLQAAQEGHTECVAYLLEKGAEVDKVNEKNGIFPLLQAAQNGHAECVAYLLEKGAEVDKVNEKNGIFPLLQAAQNGHAECVAYLLEKGAEVNQVNEKNGGFPLLLAAAFNHVECAKLLAQAGADPNQRHPVAGTVCDVAKAQGYKEPAEWLRQA